MKIALVHDFLTRIGGAERVLYELAEMYPHAPIYTLLYDEKKVGHLFPAERVRTSGLQKLPHFIRSRQRYLLPFFPQAVEQFDLSEFELVISSSGAFSHGVVTNLNTTHICYCHSPMRYAWDYTHQYQRDLKPGFFKKMALIHILKKMRIWDFLASERVDHYLANSEHIQKRITKYYRKESEVVYPPVSTKRFTPQKNHADYFLIVSRLSPYKNIDLAIELFNKTGKHLVVIGDGSDFERLRRIAGPTVEMLGAKDDDVVVEYMQNCRAFIFAGEDDFGIAPVEAMACSKPVLAYGVGGALETVVAGKTGEFFKEATLGSMEDALGRMLTNFPKYDAAIIRRRAEEFSTERFVKEIDAVVKRYTK